MGSAIEGSLEFAVMEGEQAKQFRVEHLGADPLVALQDDLYGLFVCHRCLVRPGSTQSVIDIAEADDKAAQRYLLSGQGMWIVSSIEVLMVRQGHLGGEPAEVAQARVPENCVAPHDPPLAFIKGAALEQDIEWDPELAQIMQARCVLPARASSLPNPYSRHRVLTKSPTLTL
jgi:hypothetical protein